MKNEAERVNVADFAEDLQVVDLAAAADAERASGIRHDPEKPEVPPAPKSPMETMVSDDILDEFDLEFMVDLQKTYKVNINSDLGMALDVTLLHPEASDYDWAAGHLTRLATADPTRMTSHEETMRLVEQLVACRCVVKVRDHDVWDFIKATKELVEVAPQWDKKSLRALPDFFRGVIAAEVHARFRRWHPDMLLGLSMRVREITHEESAKRKTLVETRKQARAENPT